MARRYFLDILTGTNGIFAAGSLASSGAEMQANYAARIEYVSGVYDDAVGAVTKYAEAKVSYALQHNGEVLTFQSWARNRDDIAAAAKVAEMSITTLDDLYQAIAIISGIVSGLEDLKPTAEDLLAILFSVYVTPVSAVSSTSSAVSGFLTAIGQAHDYPSYVMWVNSQYYGAAGWTGYKGHLDCVSIPSTITRLGSWCFERCAGLEEVIIPDSVVNVGSQTFRECSALTEITIPVDLAAGDAFFGNENMKFVHFTYGQTGIMDDSTHSTNLGSKHVFTSGLKSLTGVTFSDDVKYIGEQAFENCTGLISATLPTSLQEIGKEAFNGCSSLVAIEIPEGCKKLGDNCFGGCSDMLFADLPDSLEELGNSCFNNCSKMQIEPDLPANLKIIGDYCFHNCKVLGDRLIIPDEIESLGKFAFCYTPIVEVTVPTQAIGYNWTDGYYTEGNVLMRTPDIRKMTITKGTDGILKGAYNNVTKRSFLAEFPNLEELTLGEGIVALEDAALAHTGIATIHFPSTLTKIGDYAFYNCENAGFALPNVTTVGKYAFSDCTNLESISFSKKLKSIGKYAFASCSSLKNVDLGEELDAISEHAFVSCKALEEITLPDTVAEIGEDAFTYCSALRSIALGNGLKKIGYNAFRECEKLESIDIPDSVTEIGSYAFYKCLLNSVHLGKGLTKVSDYAFYYAGPYDGITIPQSVTEIGERAFGVGYRKYKDFVVYGYKDSAAQAYAKRYEFTFVELEPEVEIVYRNLYRLYNPNSGEHFYTGGEDERDFLASLGWNYEGIACQTPETSDVPVYRLYNPNAGDHHYTTSSEERDNLVAVGWNFEGIAWYSGDVTGTPVYRLYNPNAQAAGAHHYTASEEERDNLVVAGWNFEGVSWFGK